MTAPTAPPTPPGADADAETVEHGPRRRIVWSIVAVLSIATFAFWIWGLFFYHPKLLVDELPDRTFPTAAEKICAATVDRIDTLPPAHETKDHVARAAVIDTANGYLRQMVAQLRPLAPTSPEKYAKAVDEWLHDWEDHIADRQRYADELRRDPRARFEERMKGAKQLSSAIDGYAQVNRMNDCSTPGDV